MTTRVLPPGEWPRLAGTEAESLWPLLNPASASVLVVEDEEAIVGVWVLMSVLHAECLWIAAEHRGKTAVARRLWSGMQRVATDRGAKVVATAAISDDVRALLEHVGAMKVPGDHYAMKVH